MRINIGSADKVVRIVAGIAILGAGIALKSWWGLLGIVPLATAAINFCPLYTLLGVSTRGLPSGTAPTGGRV